MLVFCRMGDLLQCVFCYSMMQVLIIKQIDKGDLLTKSRCIQKDT